MDVRPTNRNLLSNFQTPLTDNCRATPSPQASTVPESAAAQQLRSFEGLRVGSAWSGSAQVNGFSVRDTTNAFIPGWDTPPLIANWSYYKRGWRNGSKHTTEPVWTDLDHIPPSRVASQGLVDPEATMRASKAIMRRREAELDKEAARREAHMAHREMARNRLRQRHLQRHSAMAQIGAPPPMHDFGAQLDYWRRGGLQPYQAPGSPDRQERRRPATGLASSLSAEGLSMERLQAWHEVEPERPPSQMRKAAPELHCEGKPAPCAAGPHAPTSPPTMR